MPDTAHRAPKPLRAAIVYDFDGTLARGNLQELSFIPELGIDHDVFWKDVRRLARTSDADEILVYMQQMIERSRALGRIVTRDMLRRHGCEPSYFDGVESWFARIDSFAADQGLELDHYVVSSGIEEMIEGCSIYPHFSRVFASRFIYNEKGEAVWPAVAVNYTNKTQFLFRINKGIQNVWDTQAINRWMRAEERPLPFDRMIFIGDGDTDIPSMKMVTEQGGTAVAVLDPDRWNDPLKVSHIHMLIAEDRVNYVAPADYLPSSQLDVIVKGALQRIALRAGLPIVS
ncbi:MAG TPA: HAD family hydrolase [Vitreimonas sp.]|uniref:HAD family hydrolase n=1 Tax=Vitreimonas sp. TaxID=3069702 RepID=UPI002D3588EB|nr:HAD family hydrolase [Vitreimonas sp.]HYD86564.1 HAD family hydrolase [Vitreimonas sp.]